MTVERFRRIPQMGKKGENQIINLLFLCRKIQFEALQIDVPFGVDPKVSDEDASTFF